LCSLIGEIVKKLDANDFNPLADRCMQALFLIFNNKGTAAHEDAMMAIGYIVEKLEKNFMRYVPYLLVIFLFCSPTIVLFIISRYL
jgi:hypothetical protein